MGASVGTALLNTIAATATAAYLAAHAVGPGGRTGETIRAALVLGYATAAGWAAAILVLTALIVGLFLKAPRPSVTQHSNPDDHRQRLAA